MNASGYSRCVVFALATMFVVASASAEWDPEGAQWGKSEAADIRVMTWNTHENIHSEAAKQEADNDSWCAIAHIVAALKPDILLLQEMGTTGSGVDSTADLYTTLDLFLHGGTDIFTAGNPQVTSWVQKYDPAYDLPYIWISIHTDGFHRNVILSRFPFADINLDQKPYYSDIPQIIADEYATSGDGETRGFQMAEIDLDDEVYCGDLVIGNVHLKAYSDPDSMAERLRVAQRVAYIFDYWYNGAGTGAPDPHNRIIDNPAAGAILDDYTPIIAGGDLNEDELTNGRRGPAAWFTEAEFFGSNDGTDRDRTDATYDEAVEYFSGGRKTWNPGSGKLDYIIWQDSIAALRRAFVFYSGGSTPYSALPSEILSYASPGSVSYDASDHRPVIADFDLPLVADGECNPCGGYVPGDANCDGNINSFDIDPFVTALADQDAWEGSYECDYFCVNDCNEDGSVNSFDIDPFVAILAGSGK